MLGGIWRDYAYGGVLFNALKKDDGIYQLTTCSPSGEQDSMLIGSLIELAWGK